MTAPTVILFAGVYGTSPYAFKITALLFLKKITFERVEVKSAPPQSHVGRPELDLLGISYRRIPVLSIDGDFYCDTALITQELDRRFPASAGYGSLFPPSSSNDRLFVKSFDVYAARFFSTNLTIIPEAVLVHKEFAEDREAFTGHEYTAEAFRKQLPTSLTNVRSILASIDGQAGHGGKFLLGGDQPTYADISMWFPIAFLWLLHKNVDGPVRQTITDEKTFPNAIKWYGTFNNWLEDEKKARGWKHLLAPSVIEAQAAADAIKQGFKQPVTFHKGDSTDPMEANGWAKEGAKVHVTPIDSGKVPTQGTLVGLTPTTVTLQLDTGVHVHFPRFDFVITLANGRL